VSQSPDRDTLVTDRSPIDTGTGDLTVAEVAGSGDPATTSSVLPRPPGMGQCSGSVWVAQMRNRVAWALFTRYPTEITASRL
jgi:hypothetical protein